MKKKLFFLKLIFFNFILFYILYFIILFKVDSKLNFDDNFHKL